MSEYYRIRIKRGEFEVEVESHDKDYVDAKLKEHLEGVSFISAESVNLFSLVSHYEFKRES